MGLLRKLAKLLPSDPDAERIADRIEHVDRQNREVRHDLKNIESRLDGITLLIQGMRDERGARNVQL